MTEFLHTWHFSVYGLQELLSVSALVPTASPRLQRGTRSLLEPTRSGSAVLPVPTACTACTRCLYPLPELRELPGAQGEL